MAGGDTYTIIYLKMQLLSLKTEGVLTWTGLEENFADELALDLDEKPEDVEVTLMYLLKTGLAETKDNVSFFFPFVIENTGSEDASAQRVREFRKRQALQCNAEVTQVKRECNVEKEIETDIEIERREREENNSTSTRAREDENDLSRVMNFFLDRINPMPSRICIDELTQFTKSLGADVVLHALNIAIDERKTAFSYIRGILSRYERDGIKTMDDVLRAEQEHAEKKENRPKTQRDDPVPAFTPPEKRHKPVNFSTDLVEWPPGSGNYFLKGEEPKDAHG